MSNLAIKITNLNKSFKVKKQTKQVLKDVNIEIQKGQFHAFIGSNGAGKTTTIRSILGFYPDIQGTIEIDGFNHLKEEGKKRLGYVPEYIPFDKDEFRTLEYIRIFATFNTNMSKQELDKKIIQLCDYCDFHPDLLKQKPNSLSSGQKKKLLLIQALIHDPEIIILDEPAANLDVESRYQLYELLKKINKDGITIFVSSHILSELDQYVDSYTIIKDGEIKYSGLRQEVHSRFNYIVTAKENWEKLPAIFAEIQAKHPQVVHEMFEHSMRFYSDSKDTTREILSSLIVADIPFEQISEYRETLFDLYMNTQ